MQENNKPKESRQKRKRNQTHYNIMHNAKRLFEKKGLGNVTIEEITEKADVSRSTFFSHFISLEALSTEIAGVAIKDILDAYANSGKQGIEGIFVLIDKLIDDISPYPYLSTELLMNGIVKSRGKSPFYNFENLIRQELTKEKSINDFEDQEKVAIIIGSSFGLVLQKLIRGESFDHPEEMKKTIRKLTYHITGGLL